MGACIAIVLAGGVGKRFGAEVPKQFVEVRGKPILEYTLKTTLGNANVDRAVVVCAPLYQDRVSQIVERCACGKPVSYAPAGPEFIDSCHEGLMASGADEDDIVVVVSGDRPLVSAVEIDDSVLKCRQSGSGIAAIKAAFCAIRSENGASSTDYLRDQLYVTATPWAFNYGLISRAFDAYYGGGLPGVEPYPPAIYIAAGNEVFLSAGSRSNIKITHQEDLAFMERYLDEMESED